MSLSLQSKSTWLPRNHHLYLPPPLGPSIKAIVWVWVLVGSNQTGFGPNHLLIDLIFLGLFELCTHTPKLLFMTRVYQLQWYGKWVHQCKSKSRWLPRNHHLHLPPPLGPLVKARVWVWVLAGSSQTGFGANLLLIDLSFLGLFELCRHTLKLFFMTRVFSNTNLFVIGFSFLYHPLL